MMILFSLCRIFFFLVNKSYFPEMTWDHFLYLMKGGIQFDLSALLYVNSVYLVMQGLPFKFRYDPLYQKIAKWVFVMTNSIAIIVNCMDIPFFRFTNRRTTNTIFSEFSNENNIVQIILESLTNYWYVTVFTVLILVAICKFYVRPTGEKPRKTTVKKSVLYYALHGLIFVLLGYLTVLGIRGGAGKYTRPITISNATKYVRKSNETAIVLNTPFSLIRTINKNVYKDPGYFSSKEEMLAIYSPVHRPVPSGEFKPMNVVIIILESFGKEYMGYFNHHLDNGTYKGYTPFLDSLFSQGLTFEYSYCNGRKSIDAMPSVLSSIPMFIEPYILTSYSINDINGIASLLKEKGYSSAFFHGAPNGSMGFEAYAKAAGFDKYFGMNEYGDSKDFDGWWAIWDEEFLQFYADRMNEMPQPFVTSVFTASSHHPFQIPQKYEGKFKEGTLPIHKTIGYTDYALKEFFGKIASCNWFENTLFVITADHTNQPEHPEYFTDVNRYAVPVFFYHPGSDLKGKRNSFAQQIDIMPSILSYLNYDKPYIAFGHDVITSDPDKFVVNYNNPFYQLFRDDYFMQFDGEKARSLYLFKTDSLLENNLVGNIPEQTEMENLLKSIIQQYMERMTSNNLTFKE
jgi:phosphoglycerol transferase MdoB-like AlkP superfamily enzyme